MTDVYFDTSAIKLDLFHRKKNSEYTVENTDFTPKISPTVKQELLHIIAKYKVYEDFDTEISSFTAAKRLISQYMMNTLTEDISFYALDRRYEAFVDELVTQRPDFQDVYNDDDGDLPDAQDILHFAYADVAGCRKFITADSDFKWFKDSEKVQNVEEVVVMDPETNERIDSVKIDG